MPFQKGNTFFEKYNKERISKKQTSLCVICGTCFSYYPSTHKKRRFCSKNCYSVALETERKGITFSEEHKKNLRKAQLKNPTRYWLSKKRSPEDIKKFRKAHLGKKQSKETIIKRTKRGSEHYNWQGGITPLTRRRTRGVMWRQTADKIRLRDNNTCLVCGDIGQDTKLPVHHIIPFRISKDNEDDNLMTVCSSCHIKLDKEYTDNVANVERLARC